MGCIHWCPPPSLQVFPFTNLKSTPKTLGTSALNASDSLRRLSPPSPLMPLLYIIYKYYNRIIWTYIQLFLILAYQNIHDVGRGGSGSILLLTLSSMALCREKLLSTTGGLNTGLAANPSHSNMRVRAPALLLSIRCGRPAAFWLLPPSRHSQSSLQIRARAAA